MAVAASMQIGYGKDWWGSLNDLAPADSARVIDAMDRFVADPSHPSLNLEPLQGDRSRRLHSIRASDELRILLVRQGNVFVVLEAGHHDALYARAERARFVANPHTGFVGLIPISVEAPSEQRPWPVVRAEPAIPPDGPPARGVLDHWADADLAQVGFDPSAISALRGCRSEDALCELDIPDELKLRAMDLLEVTPEQYRAPSLDEAAEAEGRLRATLDEFGVLAGFSALFAPEEALRLATAPIEDWMVTLHPDQRRAVRRRFDGPARIRGSAGTGKTVVALHRAAALARRFEAEEGGGAILFTTFIKSLPPVFEGLYRRLPGTRAGDVEFVHVDKLAASILARAGRLLPVDTNAVDAAFASAHRAVVTGGSPLHDAGLTREYLRDEVRAVIKGRGLGSLDEYLAVERTGRRARLNAVLRRQVWGLREEWDRQMAQRDTADFPDRVLAARDLARSELVPRYRAAIIDEAQDLTLVGLQLVRALVNAQGDDRSDGLLIVGDGAQRIYPGGFTLRQAGVEVRGRTTVLRVNYRNTRPVIAAAMAVAGGEDVDDLGDEYRRGDAESIAIRNGVRPVLAGCGSFDDEVRFIVGHIDRLVASGAVGLGDMAVATAHNRQVDKVTKALQAAGVAVLGLDRYEGAPGDEVKVGTFHRIKGLEFKVIFLPCLGEHDFPRRRAAGQDDGEYAEQRAREVAELFVAMTRARDGLFVTCTGGPSPVLGAALDQFDVV